ncbi:restriction endonuclease subunit S [Proteus mirabilis]|uniref:restriction endonuclease subunit S n=1 Tax=Proteus mirabilis TaxID=584 RepID=UPI001FAB6280|nr:restriction endonuclease subunit S [Proteus mirabilis]MCI9766604.1 restriction endonuclease subunit S [Proteus mirabilis]MCI9770191.1 restriction endonuclease subunit S [Proteus mirabilis]MCI9773785.1 restriction endonuclease subunit S [Proteus mirabilis]
MSNGISETGLNLIPAGYKQTEVGVIPEDWEVFSLGQTIAKTQLGGNYKNSEHDTGQPLIKMGNLGRGFVKLSKQEFVIGNASESDLLNYGDVLFNTRNTLELVGKVAIWKNELPKAYFNSNLMRISFKEDLVSSNPFMNALMNSERFIKALSDIAIGTTSVAAIYNRDLFLIKVALPTKEEQTAIANALSDVDALISELEKLIAKKQAIKTASMQQLLTGRTRLPQFALREDGTPKGTKPSELGEIPEDWEVVCFSECGYFQSGSGFPTKYQGKQEGDYPFFKVSDMNNIGNENNLINSNNYISETVRNLISAKLIPVNAIVFAKIGAAIFLERKKICFQTSCIDNNMMAYIVNDKKLYYKYAYLLFKNINLAQFVEATALPSLSGRDIGQKIVALPTSEEQTAIATILSDMDAEIQALEQRLGKTRQIKQGMMQELLTGKTRLPYDKE